MLIRPCEWREINHIPDEYDTGVVEFKECKSPQIWVCAEDHANLLGIGSLVLLSKTKGRISKLFVKPEFQRQGIASKLIEHLVQTSFRHGRDYIDAQSPQLQMFLNCGFIVTGKNNRKYGGGTMMYDFKRYRENIPRP
jgi:GNAT superfamily N-acetyltransferase